MAGHGRPDFNPFWWFFGLTRLRSDRKYKTPQQIRCAYGNEAGDAAEKREQERKATEPQK